MPVDDIRATDDTRATSVNVIFVSFDWLIKSGPLQHLNSWEEGGRGVGGGARRAGSRKNVGHHCWPTERVLGFKLPKMAQMTLKVLCFFPEHFQIFSSNFFANLFLFTRVFFHNNSEN